MEAHLNECKKAINARNGKQLAKLFALPVGGSDNVGQDITNRANAGGNIANMCQRTISDENLASVAYHRVNTLTSIAASNWSAAVDGSLSMYNSLLEYLKEDNTAWILPTLVKISNDVRLLAILGDSITAGDEFIRKTLEHLTKGFTVVVKDRTPVTTGGSKKVALFAVTCVLFKIYFKVNTLQLCSKLINVIDVSAFRGGKLLHQECYPVSDVVMYFYYLGRLKLFEDKYEESRDCFMLSLRHLPGACLRNRQRIMVNLTAVNMVLGVMPTSVVAKTYGMTELYELSLAARRGDIASFDRLMGAHQQAFLRIGVYLLLEQVKVLSYRCLLKRLYLIGNANTRISLITVSSIMNSLQGQNQNQNQNQNQGDADDLDTVDIDEVECIVANLIYAGKVKGYISHQKSFLVLSKQDPFPTQAVVTVKAAGGANSVFGFGAR